ncbi:DUF3742 family protein [Dickeya dianthicola]|uniref:DUF3742 family protein n=1 Tax=Dickeya dianthicola TaxID=204039 RepID=UPI001FD4CBF6|nr:DUF3742 family protein [Dickeya dianthicola]
MNSASHNSIAERFGRWLGRGWRVYARCEQQISGWFVEQGMPVKGAFALLWMTKLTLLGLLLGVLEILCHSSNIQSKRNDICPSPSISIKRLKPSSLVRH